jgi:heme A synthase
MKKVHIIKAGFIISLLVVIFASWLQLTHDPAASTWLSVAAVLVTIFIATGIYEVLRSRRIANSEKIIWTLAFILFSGLTGLGYFLFERKRVVATQ